jgi:hypothetical protein
MTVLPSLETTAFLHALDGAVECARRPLMEEKAVAIARVVPVLLAHDLTYFPAVARVVVSCASNHVLISKGMADRDVLCASILGQS